tara:strand:+ start:82 stop:615 length:534 start_codon:yes stop_codon:yes gene_type:complete
LNSFKAYAAQLNKAILMSFLLRIIIDKRDVESGNVAPTINKLKALCSSKSIAKQHMGKVDISFQGYDDIQTELWDIKEVRNFVSALNENFTHWLFFLSQKTAGLHAILFCLLPVKRKGMAQYVDPEDINKLCQQQWWQGFNEMSEFTGLSLDPKQEEEFGMLAFEYLLTGPSVGPSH